MTILSGLDPTLGALVVKAPLCLCASVVNKKRIGTRRVGENVVASRRYPIPYFPGAITPLGSSAVLIASQAARKAGMALSMW